MPETTHPPIYQITVSGRLNERWNAWFEGMEIVCEEKQGEAPVTTLTGMVKDQASLRGLLTKVWDLGLVLLAISRVSAEPAMDLFETGGPLNGG